MRNMLVSAAALCALAIAAAPAAAQDRQTRPANPSPAAQQALAGGDQPDVLLDVPNLSVEEIQLEVQNLQVDISLDARLANLLKLTAGANASIETVSLTITGVQAQATLIVRLDNVAAIIDRTLTTIDNNPQILQGLFSTVDNTVNTVGGVANNAVGTVGSVANTAVGQLGGTLGQALQIGNTLDLAQAGLTEVRRTTDNAGNIVRQVRSRDGRLIQVVTDTADRILSVTPLSRGQ
ncbi:MAG: hypothetical protein ACFBQW_06490 [Sphingomonadaceae bacterium]